MSSNKLLIRPDWPAPANVHAATTLRTGGVSEGGYAALNLASHVGDDPTAVRQNRELISSTLQLPSKPIWLSQIHSNIVIKAEPGLDAPEADACFTDQPNMVCVVMTADCLPILGCSRDGQCIAAIHAGWRGLLGGIITNTIQMMKTTDVLIWLGPAIGLLQFEVGAEVRSAFINKSAGYAAAFQPKNTDKWLADIYQLARIELASLNISAVYGGDYCTVTDSTRFYSYRRDQQTGRMATLIWRD
jgi:YfiH family protein